MSVFDRYAKVHPSPQVARCHPMTPGIQACSTSKQQGLQNIRMMQNRLYDLSPESALPAENPLYDQSSVSAPATDLWNNSFRESHIDDQEACLVGQAEPGIGMQPLHVSSQLYREPNYVSQSGREPSVMGQAYRETSIVSPPRREPSVSPSHREPSVGLSHREPSVGLSHREPSVGLSHRDPSVSLSHRKPSLMSQSVSRDMDKYDRFREKTPRRRIRRWGRGQSRSRSRSRDVWRDRKTCRLSRSPRAPIQPQYSSPRAATRQRCDSPLISDLRPRRSDLRPRRSDLRPRRSDLRPRRSSMEKMEVIPFDLSPKSLHKPSPRTTYKRTPRAVRRYGGGDGIRRSPRRPDSRGYDTPNSRPYDNSSSRPQYSTPILRSRPLYVYEDSF